MKLAIIGSGGFIGSSLMRYAGQRCDVIGVSSRNFDFTARDARDTLAGMLAGRDAAILCSIINPPATANTGWESVVNANRQLIKTLLSAFSRIPELHLINLSSDAVYPYGETRVSEETPIEPKTTYASIHVEWERLCLAELGERCTIARLTQVYGSQDPHNAYGPCRMVRSALKEGVVRLFGQGEDERDHVSIYDVCFALFELAKIRPAATINIASGQSVRFADIAARIITAMPETRLIHQPRSVPLIHRRISIERLKAAVSNYRPINVLDDIDRLIAETREILGR